MSINNLDFDPNELSKKGLDSLNHGHYEEALTIFEKLNSHFPNNVDLLNLIGFANLEIKLFEDALKAYTNSLKINPNQIEALFNRAIVNEKLGYFTDAIVDYDAVSVINPNNLDVFFNKAAIYEDQGRFEEALEEINCLLSKEPKNFKALINKGNIYESLSMFDKSLELFDEALDIEPNNSDIYINKANLYKKINNFEKALENFNHALNINNDSYLAKYNLSLLQLYEKKFQLGWLNYEERFNLYPKPKFATKIPLLDKFNKIDKILVWGEQGIGDQVFFGSMLDHLRDFPNITVALDQRLIKIFQNSFQQLNFISNKVDDKFLEFEKQLSICSLGKYLMPDFNFLNEQKKPFLKSNKIKNKTYLTKIKNNNKPICGISWRSLNKKTGHSRSMSLESLLPLMEMNKYHFLDLQYDETNIEIENFNKKYNQNVQTINELDKYNDIEGVFSLIDCCDCILTIDNSIAHFSGALGKKTFLMLPYGVGSIWYWHDDDISIWYPSIKIFRQQKSNDWKSVISQISYCL